MSTVGRKALRWNPVVSRRKFAVVALALLPIVVPLGRDAITHPSALTSAGAIVVAVLVGFVLLAAALVAMVLPPELRIDREGIAARRRWRFRRDAGKEIWRSTWAEIDAISLVHYGGHDELRFVPRDGNPRVFDLGSSFRKRPEPLDEFLVELRRYKGVSAIPYLPPGNPGREFRRKDSMGWLTLITPVQTVVTMNSLYRDGEPGWLFAASPFFLVMTFASFLPILRRNIVTLEADGIAIRTCQAPALDRVIEILGWAPANYGDWTIPWPQLREVRLETSPGSPDGAAVAFVADGFEPRLPYDTSGVGHIVGGAKLLRALRDQGVEIEVAPGTSLAMTLRRELQQARS